MKSQGNEGFSEKTSQILYTVFQIYEPLLLRNLANHIKSLHLLIILTNEGIETWII